MSNNKEPICDDFGCKFAWSEVCVAETCSTCILRSCRVCPHLWDCWENEKVLERAAGDAVVHRKRKRECPLHLHIINKIPGYSEGTAKRDTRKIKEIMRKFEYDDDAIESINDDFCLGWDTAKEIIAQMLSDTYWKYKEAGSDHD